MLFVPLITILGCTAFSSALATREMPLPPARMFPDGLDHDFGKVFRGMQAKHTFRVVNTFKVPLHIISLRAS